MYCRLNYARILGIPNVEIIQAKLKKQKNKIKFIFVYILIAHKEQASIYANNINDSNAVLVKDPRLFELNGVNGEIGE